MKRKQFCSSCSARDAAPCMSQRALEPRKASVARIRTFREFCCPSSTSNSVSSTSQRFANLLPPAYRDTACICPRLHGKWRVRTKPTEDRVARATATTATTAGLVHDRARLPEDSQAPAAMTTIVLQTGIAAMTTTMVSDPSVSMRTGRPSTADPTRTVLLCPSGMIATVFTIVMAMAAAAAVVSLIVRTLEVATLIGLTVSHLTGPHQVVSAHLSPISLFARTTPHQTSHLHPLNPEVSKVAEEIDVATLEVEVVVAAAEFLSCIFLSASS